MNQRFLKLVMAASLCGAVAVSCGSRNDGPLLKGHIEGLDGEDKPYIGYSFDGDIQSTVYEGMVIDSLGNFEFNPVMPDGVDFMEVDIYVGDKGYGAYVEKGATTDMSIDLTGGDDYAAVSFTGDNVDVNETVNVAAQAYDFMRYTSMDPSMAKSYDEYSSLLESENARVVEALKKISNSDKRDYYTRLYDLKYTAQKMGNIGNRLYEEGKVKTTREMLENPEYKALYDRIDINDPMMVKSRLLTVWVDANCPYQLDLENPDVDGLISNLRFIDENVKEPANRRSALLADPFFFIEKLRPSKADAEKYMSVYSEVAAEYPDIVERYRKSVDAIVDLKDGERMPYYPVLTDPDGKQVNLADLTGKVTYIDVWATWCGPCCREIPYLEKVVERFKGNDKIQFISVSVDDDLDAWRKKLDADKPEWAQYVLSPEEHKAFMSALGINGIPRFILLDAEGRFISNDAVRPSSDDIDKVLNEAIR